MINVISITQIFFVIDKKNWINTKYLDWFYYNHSDKQDPFRKPFPKPIPFYSSNEYIHEQLVIFASTWNTRTRNKIYNVDDLPLYNDGVGYPSWLAATAHWETQFQLLI